jgi:hypothetical protein
MGEEVPDFLQDNTLHAHASMHPVNSNTLERFYLMFDGYDQRTPSPASVLEPLQNCLSDHIQIEF